MYFSTYKHGSKYTTMQIYTVKLQFKLQFSHVKTVNLKYSGWLYNHTQFFTIQSTKLKYNAKV